MKKVVCAAIRINGRVIICGARHFDKVMFSAISALTEAERYSASNVEQGFINTLGEFLTRTEAWCAAVHNKQIIGFVGNQIKADLLYTDVELFSENLY